MGVMRFEVHPPGRLSRALAERAYFSGADQVPWQSIIRWSERGFELERAESESGHMNVPWPVDGFGEVTLSTGTLMERAAPYQLQVELARGQLNRLRGQLAEWQEMRLAVPPVVMEKLHAALESFARAATSQHEAPSAAEQAERAITAATDAGERLVESYVEQALAARKRMQARLDVLLGVHLGKSVPEGAVSRGVLAAFNAAVVPLNWLDVEADEGRSDWSVYDSQLDWCRDHGLAVCGGPLLQLDHRGLPDWICLWDGELQNLVALVSGYVKTAVMRYRGRVQYWNCVARMDAGSVLSLSEEERLRLAVQVIEIVRTLDPQTPLLVSFDQPWGEYLSDRDFELSPLHVADALSRAGIGLAGIALEMNMGYHPGGTLARDRLDVSRQIDRWSLLGLPLYAMLTCASSGDEDPHSRGTSKPLVDRATSDAMSERQRAQARGLVELLLAKPAVRGIFWNQLRDREPHDFPHGGLFDAADRPKPALAALAEIRKAHLT